MSESQPQRYRFKSADELGVYHWVWPLVWSDRAQRDNSTGMFLSWGGNWTGRIRSFRSPSVGLSSFKEWDRDWTMYVCVFSGNITLVCCAHSLHDFPIQSVMILTTWICTRLVFLSLRIMASFLKILEQRKSRPLCEMRSSVFKSTQKTTTQMSLLCFRPTRFKARCGQTRCVGTL